MTTTISKVQEPKPTDAVRPTLLRRDAEWLCALMRIVYVENANDPQVEATIKLAYLNVLTALHGALNEP